MNIFKKEIYIDNILPIKNKATSLEIQKIYKTFKPKTEKEWTCCNCGAHHIRDVNAAINLKNYVPMEGRELKPVDNVKVKSLALLALQTDSLDEAGSTTGNSVQECAKSLLV